MTQQVQRHSLVVRITHWSVAMSGIILIFSGFGQMPVYKRYNIVQIPGLAWSSNYDITLLLHYVSAAIFTAVVFFHLVYHWRRGEYSVFPKKGDIKESIRSLMAMLGRNTPAEHGKFQAKQRVIYAVFGGTSMALIITGLLKSYKNLGKIILDPGILQLAAFLHTALAMLFFLLLIAHIGALLMRQHRPLIPSMLTGKIDRGYAQEHHPAWKLPK